MSNSIIFVFIFTFIIHTINTLAYSVRLVGIQTGRLTVSFSLFNILVLLSRTANALQVPILAKKVETDLGSGILNPSTHYFYFILFAATLGTIAGAVLMPTFRRILVKFVQRFNIDRSIPQVIVHSFTKSGIKQFKEQFKIPSSDNFKHLKSIKSIPKRIIGLNFLAVAFLTAGSLATMLASYLNPELRLTSGSFAPLLTGLATVILVIFVDPFFSLLTDDILEGKTSPYYYSKCIVFMIISRVAGTLLAQLLLYPMAVFVIWAGTHL